MIGIVLVTHGRLGEEALKTLEQISGRMKQATSVSIDPRENSVAGREKISGAISSVDAGDGVIIMTDVLGGAPASIALSFHQEGKVEVITGLNLPMLIELAELRKAAAPLQQAAARAKDCAIKNINLATEVLSAAVSVKHWKNRYRTRRERAGRAPRSGGK